MIDTTLLLKRADAWDDAHPPAGIGPIIRKVLAANLPNGANLWVQTAAQFTGKEEGLDLVRSFQEHRLDYSQKSRLSFGKSMDCTSFWWGKFEVFFDIYIGYYSEDQWKRLQGFEIKWSEREATDHILYKFSSRNPHATHAANYMGRDQAGQGFIAHTTSASNPYRFEADTYAASSRVGIYRRLTAAQRQSLIIDNHDAAQPTTPGIDLSLLPYLIWPNGKPVTTTGKPCPLVKRSGKYLVDVNTTGSILGAPIHYLQWKMTALGFYHGKVDGIWGAKSHAAAVAMQKAAPKSWGFQGTGRVGERTWRYAIEARP